MSARSFAMTALRGVALSAAFFYPLAAALESQALYMQWTARDHAEFIGAFALLAASFGIALRAVSSVTNPHRRLIALSLVYLVPLTSLSSGLVRAFPAVERALTSGARQWIAVAIVSGGAVAAFVAFRFAARASRLLHDALLVLSPLALVVLVGEARVERIEVSFARAVKQTTPAAPQRIVVLVFDELSKRQLFAGRDVRPQYQGFAKLADHATVYHTARSGGSDTLVSMLSLLDLRDYHTAEITKEGIFVTSGGHDFTELEDDDDARLLKLARDRGFSTGVIGWMLPYCVLTDDVADRCLSLSPYNAGNVSAGGSLWSPIKTTLLLWPYERPTGFIKVPLYLNHRRAMIENADAALDDMVLNPRGPTFVLAHLPLPHAPFMYDRGGFNPPPNPFAQTIDNYVAQLAYLDSQVSKLVDRWSAAGVFSNTTVVVTADHEFREVLQGEARVEVPLLVLEPSQARRVDASTPVMTLDVVRALVEGSR